MTRVIPVPSLSVRSSSFLCLLEIKLWHSVGFVFSRSRSRRRLGVFRNFSPNTRRVNWTRTLFWRPTRNCIRRTTRCSAVGQWKFSFFSEEMSVAVPGLCSTSSTPITTRRSISMNFCFSLLWEIEREVSTNVWRSSSICEFFRLGGEKVGEIVCLQLGRFQRWIDR